MDDRFEMIKQDWQKYKNEESKTEEFKNSFIEKAKTFPSNMWHVIFASDPDMYERFLIVESELLAKECLDDYLANPQKVLLKMTAELAIANSEYKDDNRPFGEIKPARLEAWTNTFKDIPDFIVSLRKRMDANDKWRKENIPHYIKQTFPVLETIILTIPYDFLTEENKKSDIIPQSLITKIEQQYNSFGLHDYMDIPFNIQSSSLKGDGENWIFSFDVISKIDSERRTQYINTLKEQLSGQLSNGWGENTSQQGLLVGNQTIYPGFDYKHIDLIENNPLKKMKP